ncbi:MAG: restriction endonuclease subunit S [Desulfobulbaceae bacterium]|nr:restriction endonuclease subunit S [Desulfobulbaceae bacterium]
MMVLSDVPNGRAIAKCYFVESDNPYPMNQRICKSKPISIVGKFLFCILDRNPFFLSFDDGVKQTNLRKEDVLGCPLYLPLLPAEQQKISESLSSIDELIAAQTQKLDTLKTHKKALMQQLFPAMEEVSS